jgi:Leucine-rich repeat (LRR) protein
LLLVVGILGVVGARYARQWRPEQQAIAEIEKLGGLASARIVIFPTHATDADLAHLDFLPRLTRLTLSRNQVTDAGLVHLKPLTKLQELWLRDTPVTDAGLVHLKDLTNLRYVYLRDTQATHAGAKDLKQALPNLIIDW